MILIINVCRYKSHYYEFVKPIEDIIKKEFITKHYDDLKKKDLDKASKVIICGTSLKDNQFLKDIKRFEWLKDIKKPVLGICAGMQIISLIFNGKLKKKKEIGYYKEIFNDFLGLKGEQEVYHLHNNYTTLPKNFKEFTDSKIPQAINKDNLYGVLFHPEVRQKELIMNFINKI